MICCSACVRAACTSRNRPQRALENFFRKGNLIALRELALRKTADRVDLAMREYRKEKAVRGAWAARERLLVAVGPDCAGRAAGARRQAPRRPARRRMAGGVSSRRRICMRLSEHERNRRIAILRLAELAGRRGDHARRLIGRGRAARSTRAPATSRASWSAASNRPRWRRLLRASTTDQLLDASRDIDVHGDRAQRRRPSAGQRAGSTSDSVLAAGSDKRALAALSAGGGGHAGRHRRLLAVLRRCTRRLGAGQSGDDLPADHGAGGGLRRPARGDPELGARRGWHSTSCSCRRAFTFAVSDVQYLITFAIMLSRGADHRQSQCQRAPAGARRRLSRAAHGAAVCDEPAAGDGPRPRRDGRGRGPPREPGVRQPRGGAVPRRAGPHGLSARQPARRVLYRRRSRGRAVGVRSRQARGPGYRYPERRGRAVSAARRRRAHIRRTRGAAAAIPGASRCRSSFACWRRLRRRSDWHWSAPISPAHAQAAEVRAETEAIRNALLASISHDLRTPLATIAAGAATLAGNLEALSDADRRRARSHRSARRPRT